MDKIYVVTMRQEAKRKLQEAVTLLCDTEKNISERALDLLYESEHITDEINRRLRYSKKSVDDDSE